MDECYPSGESPRAFFLRINDSFEHLCEDQCTNNEGKNIALVTHGGVINVVYHLLKDIEWSNINNSFPIAHTSIHKVDIFECKWDITPVEFS
ncbi:histidine phosphatase family protein [Paenibacillus sp. FSL K6-0276]|uniref:histidine phosphatase family protein n=1 Tax=Paenibacillus sp. FSL K6-0276 TaxID=2921450 RepID=UPI0030EDB819